MQVLKFGGSSVANAVHISKCIHIIQKAIEKDKTIVVVSAWGVLQIVYCIAPGCFRG